MTSDGTFFLFYDWLNSVGDKFIEHGHRLQGAAAGFLAIGLVAITTLTESRGWVKKFSFAILAAVVLQGVLGGARVVFDQRTLAMIHGCTGPLFFAMCVAMVVFTSRWWAEAQPIAADQVVRKTFRLAIVCACLAYAQLVVGAVVRHSPYLMADWTAMLFQTAVYFHVLLGSAHFGPRVFAVSALFAKSIAANGQHLFVGTGRYSVATWCGDLAGKIRRASLGERVDG